MWLFTNIGFFSIVQKPGTEFLTVRARVSHDLDLLRDRYLPTLSPTQAKGGTDYPWRATTSHADFAAAMGKIALDIDYGNFKNEIAARAAMVGSGRPFMTCRKKQARIPIPHCPGETPSRQARKWPTAA